jgi:peptide/nickel transport system permease protein
MGYQLLKRTAILAASLLSASVLIFAFLSVLPGDPAEVALGVGATPDAVAELQARFGTDRPLVVQYLDWIAGLPRGDFGVSYVTGAVIGPQIIDRFLVTLWLVGAGMVVALLIAVPLGTLAAVRHRRASGVVLSGISQVGIAIPNFLAGILLIGLFAVQLRWFPAGGWIPPAQDPLGFVRRLLLPAIALGLIEGAVLSRYVRSTILHVLREDFLRTARAKGLRPYQALMRHGLRNASIPVVTVLGLQLAVLMVGAVVIERVFVLPGLGSLLLDGVANRDLLLVQGVVMVLVLFVLVINYLVDVAYTVLDPRLRAVR